MSYSRIGPNSDVYVMMHVDGFFVCYMCQLHASWDYFSTTEILRHLQEHLQHGHKVEATCIQRITQNKEANDLFIKQKGARTQIEIVTREVLAAAEDA